MPTAGPVERSLRRELRQLDALNTTLGQSALTLARALDAGAGLATAAVARELRATVDAVKRGDDGSDELDGFLAGLRPPVRDSADEA